MPEKQLFTADYEMHASARLLYPFLSTPSGLSEWYCSNVTISPEKKYTFHWSSEQRKAVLTTSRAGHSVRFEFLDAAGKEEDKPDYIEFRLETDELTQLTYLRVRDYSDFDDLEELQDLWDDLISKLRQVVGG